MTIEYKCEHTDRVDPSTLKGHPKNPNKHPSRQVDALAGNITRYGWRHPIVVSKLSGLIVCGHCRQQAALKLGCDAPVDYQDFADETEELAVLMADNIIPELAEMDSELKVAALEELKIHDVELEIIGADDFKYKPPVIGSDDLNNNPGQRMNRNNGAREVVAVGRFIGAAEKELTTQATAKLEEIGSNDEAASLVCRLILENL